MEQVDVLIAGAGPAGLAAAACLKQRHVPFVIVEAGASVGTSWHGHYDRLWCLAIELRVCLSLG